MSAPKRLTEIQSGIEDGITWAICRASLYGAANGYVQIPEGHPWHGLDYDLIDVDVHGGLTFADGEWIGFDTLHSQDHWPESPDYCTRFGGHSEWCVQWTDEKVADAARELARKVAEAAA